MVVAPTTSALPGGRFGAFRFIERVERSGPAELYKSLWSEAPSAAERICLLKRLRPELSSSPAFVRMFLDEARTMAQLSHPNVVRVFQHGELEGLPYMAMEPLEGLSLAQLHTNLRAAAKKLPIEVAVYIAAEVATALAHAHDASDGEGNPLHIVHRDVRPANVLLLSTGGIKLVEFGVAKVASFVSQSMNVSGAGQGKPSYVSPEQLAGAPLDGRSDLFSLGVVLWEMLCGRALFPPTTPDQAAARVMTGALPRPSSVRAEVPGQLDDLVMRLLERELPSRYPVARLLNRDLEPFIPDRADSRRAVASMVRVGMDLRPDPGPEALVIDTPGPGGRRITRVALAPQLAALLGTARMRQLAGRIPGSVRRVTGLVPVMAARIRRQISGQHPVQASRPQQPATAERQPPARPLPGFARLLGARRPFVVQAVAVTLVAFLGGVMWQGMRVDAAPPPRVRLVQAISPAASGVRIERLPDRSNPALLTASTLTGRPPAPDATSAAAPQARPQARVTPRAKRALASRSWKSRPAQVARRKR